jgi:hypothetical protein
LDRTKQLKKQQITSVLGGTISQSLISLKGQCHEIFASGFFDESVSPQPQSIALGLFRIFSKIRGDIRKSRCTTGINDTGGKFFHQFR